MPPLTQRSLRLFPRVVPATSRSGAIRGSLLGARCEQGVGESSRVVVGEGRRQKDDAVHDRGEYMVDHVPRGDRSMTASALHQDRGFGESAAQTIGFVVTSDRGTAAQDCRVDRFAIVLQDFTGP